MNLDEFRIKLSEMLYEVFGGTGTNAIIKHEEVLKMPHHGLKIYKNNGSFLVCFDGALHFKGSDYLKALWCVGEEIAKIRIHAATVSG